MSTLVVRRYFVDISWRRQTCTLHANLSNGLRSICHNCLSSFYDYQTNFRCSRLADAREFVKNVRRHRVFAFVVFFSAANNRRLVWKTKQLPLVQQPSDVLLTRFCRPDRITMSFDSFRWASGVAWKTSFSAQPLATRWSTSSAPWPESTGFQCDHVQSDQHGRPGVQVVLTQVLWFDRTRRLCPLVLPQPQ